MTTKQRKVREFENEAPKEKAAIDAGLSLLSAKWDGSSQFDAGMRLLQDHLGVARRRYGKKARKP